MIDKLLQFSVVICTFNRVEWLRNALTSICEQTLNDLEYEIIVVDGEFERWDVMNFSKFVNI